MVLLWLWWYLDDKILLHSKLLLTLNSNSYLKALRLYFSINKNVFFRLSGAISYDGRTEISAFPRLHIIKIWYEYHKMYMIDVGDNGTKVVIMYVLCSISIFKLSTFIIRNQICYGANVLALAVGKSKKIKQITNPIKSKSLSYALRTHHGK